MGVNKTDLENAKQDERDRMARNNQKKLQEEEKESGRSFPEA